MSAPVPWGVIPLDGFFGDKTPTDPPWPSEWASTPPSHRFLALMGGPKDRPIPLRALSFAPDGMVDRFEVQGLGEGRCDFLPGFDRLPLAPHGGSVSINGYVPRRDGDPS